MVSVDVKPPCFLSFCSSRAELVTIPRSGIYIKKTKNPRLRNAEHSYFQGYESISAARQPVQKQKQWRQKWERRRHEGLIPFLWCGSGMRGTLQNFLTAPRSEGKQSQRRCRTEPSYFYELDFCRHRCLATSAPKPLRFRTTRVESHLMSPYTIGGAAAMTALKKKGT